MSIKTQLRIAASLPALFGLMVAVALWVSWGQVERTRARAVQAESIVRDLSELNALTQEYLLFGGARVSDQLAKYQVSLAAVLAAADFAQPAEQSLVQSLRRGQRDLERLQAVLLSGSAVSREQVAGALLVKVQDLRFKARRLAALQNREVIAIQRQVDALVLIALGALTVLSIALLTWVSRRLIRGLDRLALGMRRVEDGELTHEIPVGRGAELDRLAVAFNGMTRRLRESYTSIERLGQEIEERRLAEQEVRRYRDHLEDLVAERTAALNHRTAELEAVNADLEGFSYSVSHDLRAPLRAIDGFAAILREDYAPHLDAEGVRLLGVVSENAQRMGQLIDDILAFSRAGRQTLHLTALDMNALVREVWQGLEPHRQGRVVRLYLGDLPSVIGDPGAIRQVWANLLNNALKFSRHREPAVIEVAGRREAGAVVYTVGDNGVGFQPAYAAKLFGLFQRLHGMDEFEGTGVGLAIVKRYVEKHGGWVAGEGSPDAGATFRFSMPVGGHDGAGDAPADEA